MFFSVIRGYFISPIHCAEQWSESVCKVCISIYPICKNITFKDLVLHSFNI